jgi:hypothetical protein
MFPEVTFCKSCVSIADFGPPETLNFYLTFFYFFGFNLPIRGEKGGNFTLNMTKC